MTAIVCGALHRARSPGPAVAATIDVPGSHATIQAAVDAAAPGDTIRVASGTYPESVRITALKAGLTLEGADAASPPVILGTPNRSNDAIRVDRASYVTFRNLRLQGAYDGVRLNDVDHALLVGLYIENHALGIRVNQGSNNQIVGCTIVGTRVEQGILIKRSPGSTLSQTAILQTARDGLTVTASPGVVIDHVTVTGSRNGDGIDLSRSAGARIEQCTAHGHDRDGIRVANTAGLVLSGNAANDNHGVGLRVERSFPYVSVVDVATAGNHASGNLSRDILVFAPSCASSSSGCVASSTTTIGSTTSTTTSTTPTTQPGALTPTSWRFYVRMTTASGTISVTIPLLSTDPAVDAPIATAHVGAFRIGDQVTEAEIAALGGDTLERLTSAAQRYARDRAASYPPPATIIELRWAMRVFP
jgi:parallel beta-helix repeat protein